jgi:CRISPR-associated exonuclease Cas4
MFNEEDYIPISALQHVLFCERQYALIHLEQVWEENLFTAEGRILHERVDVTHHESRRDTKTEYGMALCSRKHGLIGKADVVEIKKNKSGGYVEITPVEFKRGRTKPDDWDIVQLCAQALCLEEMFSLTIRSGQFYYLQEHRRSDIELSDEIREKTLETIERVRRINASKQTPVPVYNKKRCDRCSIFDLCMPKVVNKGGKNVMRYIQAQTRRVLSESQE